MYQALSVDMNFFKLYFNLQLMPWKTWRICFVFFLSLKLLSPPLPLIWSLIKVGYLQPASERRCRTWDTCLEKSQERLQVKNYLQGGVRGSIRQGNSSFVGNCVYVDAFTVELTAKINWGGRSGKWYWWLQFEKVLCCVSGVLWVRQAIIWC